MAAGKTRVGAELARRLAWEHVDLDSEIERSAGRAVAEIFAREGEGGFRAREAAATRELEERERLVLSTGGGWAAQPGLWDRLASGTFFAWLRVSPAEALARAAGEAGSRPLLQSADSEGRVRALLREREPFYGRAHAVVDTDGRDPADICTDLLNFLAARGLALPPSGSSRKQS